ncbi:acylphosphatase [Faunimonas sp. B44]|uniref:acylphosphatase n=1 Tax=Faunimonas sp. B44 TaxID=3461493 RepID=UPI004044FFE9
MKAVAARIEGLVQGVGFRAWTKRQADRLEVFGWVRNEPDGTVSALFCGPRESVDAMVALCRRGPPGSHVTHVQAADAELTNPLPTGFVIRRDN